MRFLSRGAYPEYRHWLFSLSEPRSVILQGTWDGQLAPVEVEQGEKLSGKSGIAVRLAIKAFVMDRRDELYAQREQVRHCDTSHRSEVP